MVLDLAYSSRQAINLFKLSYLGLLSGGGIPSLKGGDSSKKAAKERPLNRYLEIKTCGYSQTVQMKICCLGIIAVDCCS